MSVCPHTIVPTFHCVHIRLLGKRSSGLDNLGARRGPVGGVSDGMGTLPVDRKPKRMGAAAAGFTATNHIANKAGDIR